MIFRRTYSALCGILACSLCANAQPTNDNCGNATIISTGSHSFTLLDATQDGAASCFNQMKDIWFEYVAPATGIAVVGVTGTNVAFETFDVCGGSPSGCAVAGPSRPGILLNVAQDQHIIIRLSLDSSNSGMLTITAPAMPPSNDDCSTASNTVVDTDYFFNTAVASSGTSCQGPIRDVWYSFIMPGSSNQANQVIFSTDCGMPTTHHMVFYRNCDESSFDCSNSTPGDCGLQKATILYGGETIKVQVLPRLFTNPGPSVFHVTTIPVAAWDEVSDGSHDSGDLPATAQVTIGNGPLDRISGTFVDGATGIGQWCVDMYKIRICNPGEFSATVRGPDGAYALACGGGKLCLFDANGYGVTYSDDAYYNDGHSDDLPYITGQFLPSQPADYYIAYVASEGQSFSKTPLSSTGLIWEDQDELIERAPDGPGHANPITGWTPAFCDSADTYRIALTGACFATVPTCPADFNSVNGVTVQDIFDFLTAWLAGNSSADFNHVNGVTVQDIFDFLTAWLAGC